MRVLAAMALAFLGAPADEIYEWPLDLPRVLTSSFGEYRVGRLHMGIDLRTGPIGKDVHAAEDGYVARVRCSPYGYGKAVYVKLKDGNTVVYAHLDEFAPELRDYVRAAQHARKRYTVDLYPEAGAFPVTRGDPIAKSGQTGIGVPHLHYEIREPSGMAINPRRLALSWPDTTRPRIRKVLIAPGSPDATINGDLLPLVLEPHRTQEGDYRCDPVVVSGPVGFGVDAIDPANGGAIRLGVRTVRTAAGDQPIFQIRQERLSYDHVQDGVVIFHPFLLDEGRFLLQWRWPGNDSEALDNNPSEGWFDARGEAVDVTIVVEDFLGNAVTLTVPLRPAPAQAPEVAVHGAEGFGTVEVDCFGDWLVITARFNREEERAPILLARTKRIQRVPFRRISATVFRAAYAPPIGTREAVLRVSHPRIEARAQRFAVARRGEGERELRLGPLEIGIKSNSPYGTLFLCVDETRASATPALNPLGKAYRVWPSHAPIDEAITLSFPAPGGATDPSRLHVYRRAAGGWDFVPTTRKNGRLAVATRRLGTFALCEDVVPPAIRILEPRPGADLQTRRPAIRVAIADQGSGVAEYAATCNGHWLLMEYDPERSLLVWAQDEDLPGDHAELRVRVMDEAGNVATETRILELPQDPEG